MASSYVDDPNIIQNMRFIAYAAAASFLLSLTAPAITQSLVEVRFVDVPADQILEAHNPQWLDTLIRSESANETLSAILSITDESPAKLSGVIDWIYPTEHDPMETSGNIGGTILPGGLPRTTATPTAFQTRRVGAELEIEVWDVTDIMFHVTDCLRLENSAPPGGDPVVVPRFFSRRAIGKDLEPVPSGRWQLLASQQNPHDEKLLTLACYRFLTTPEILTDTERENGRTIHTLIESFELAPAAMERFVESLDGSTDHSAARALVDQLLESGQASVLHSQWFNHPSGIPMKQSSGLEYSYPTEMDPPELPNYLHGVHVDDSDLATGVSPTAFETRNCGVYVEIQSTLDPDSGRVSTTLTHTSCQLDILHQIGTGLAKVCFPFFPSVRCTTDVISEPGKPHLVAVITPPKRTSHQGMTQTESALDMPVYQTTGAPRTVIFLTAKSPAPTK